MINENELRIGNWVLVEIGLPYLDKHKIKAEDLIGISTGIHIIYPIPLTEEILLKCGFRENIKYKNTFYLHYEVLNGAKILDIDISAKVLIFDSVEININHLHQLQNIYFALTGEELNIQL